MSDFAADDLDFGRSDPAQGAAAAAPHGGATGAVVAERTISPVAGRFGLGRGGKATAVLGLVAGCGVFLAATWTHPKAHRPKPATQEPARQVVDWSAVKAAPSTPAGPGAAPAAVGVPVASTPAAGFPTLADPGAGAPSLTASPDGQVVPALTAGAGGPAGATGAVHGGADAQGPAEARAAAERQAAAARTAKLQAIRSAPLLAYSAEVRGGAGGVGAAPSPVAVRGAEGGAASELDQLRRGSGIGLVRAQRLPDRNFLLTAGALLPCVLETALDTSAPGFVTCRIPRDIYSDSGGVVLMEKGSRVLGEYRSGFAQGRARIFVVWDRITTPGGVTVEVSSPASDALGRAGFDGRIDSHFWRRFGGALLLTTVGGGISAAATADARFASVAQAPNEAAAVALQNSINIPPTLTKPQGAEVAIFVSRDLDFSSVYALKGR